MAAIIKLSVDVRCFFVVCIVEKYPYWVFYYFVQSVVFLGILFFILTYPFKIPKSLFGYKNLKSVMYGFILELLKLTVANYTISYREPHEEICSIKYKSLADEEW